jgi:hypothetical protein
MDSVSHPPRSSRVLSRDVGDLLLEVQGVRGPNERAASLLSALGTFDHGVDLGHGILM